MFHECYCERGVRKNHYSQEKPLTFTPSAEGVRGNTGKKTNKKQKRGQVWPPPLGGDFNFDLKKKGRGQWIRKKKDLGKSLTKTTSDTEKRGLFSGGWEGSGDCGRAVTLPKWGVKTKKS